MPYFKSNQCSLYYYTTGSAGMPVVFISGMAANHRSWGFQLVDLKRYFQLLAIDNRGTGRSEDKLNGLSIEGMAADVGKLLSILDVEKVHLVGFSMGGMIALEYAAKNPEKVCNVVLSSLPILDNLGPFDAFVNELNSILTGGNSEYLFQMLSSKYFSFAFLNGRQYDIMTDFFGRNSGNYRPETISRQIQAIREWLILKKWTIGCNHPCMMIFGSEDNLVPLSTSSALASEAFPHAVKKVLKGAGHAAHIEKPKKFNKMVCDFLRNQ